MVAAKSACPVCKPPCNRRNSRGRQPAKRGGNDGAEGNDDHGNDGGEGNDDHDGWMEMAMLKREKVITEIMAKMQKNG